MRRNTSDKESAGFTFTILSIFLAVLMMASLYKGIDNAHVYAQSYDCMIPVSSKETSGQGARRINYYLSVKVTPDNFPAVSSETLHKAHEKSYERLLLVSSQYYSSVSRGDDIHIEYADSGGQLHLRRADNHVPSWLYGAMSFCSFLGLTKIYRAYFP